MFFRCWFMLIGQVIGVYWMLSMVFILFSSLIGFLFLWLSLLMKVMIGVLCRWYIFISLMVCFFMFLVMLIIISVEFIVVSMWQVFLLKLVWLGVLSRLMILFLYGNCIIEEVMEMLCFFFSVIQLEVVWWVVLWFLIELVIWIVFLNSSSFLVSVVLLVLGWEMMVKVW